MYVELFFWVTCISLCTIFLDIESPFSNLDLQLIFTISNTVQNINKMPSMIFPKKLIIKTLCESYPKLGFIIFILSVAPSFLNNSNNFF